VRPYLQRGVRESLVARQNAWLVSSSSTDGAVGDVAGGGSEACHHRLVLCSVA
jgi:hypothetical protein